MFATFSSVRPQVITIGIGAGAESARSTPPAKREIRSKRGKPVSCWSVVAAEVAAGLQEEPAEEVAVDAVRVEGGKRAEARAHPDAGSRQVGGGGELAKRRDDLGGERVRVAGRCGVRLVPVARRREQRGPERLQLELGDRRVEHAEQRRVLRVLGPVVDDEQRQQRVGLDAVRRPDEPVDVSPQEPRPDRERLDRPGRGLVVVEPDGTLVPVELEHGALAERRARAQRVFGVGDGLGRPVRALDLELVLEPREPVRTGNAQLPRPRAAAPAELRRCVPLVGVRPQPHGLDVGCRRSEREHQLAHAGRFTHSVATVYGANPSSSLIASMPAFSESFSVMTREMPASAQRRTTSSFARRARPRRR